MTFRELCLQTAKECGVGISYDQMQRILVTQWRLILEELLLRPGESRIMLSGILQIYLKRKTLNCGIWKNGEVVDRKKEVHYCYRIKPGTPLRMVMRGDMDIKDLTMGGFPLYFDQASTHRDNSVYKEGKLKLDKVTRDKSISNNIELQHIIEEQKKKKFNDKLPED